MAKSDIENDQTSELLPWYLNGTLSGKEAEHVRNAINESPAVQAEADQADRLFKVLGEERPVPMLTHERIERVMQRLDSEPQQVKPFARLLNRIRSARRRPSFGVGGLVPIALSVAVVALVAVMSLQQPGSDNVEYRTLYEDRPSIPIQVQLVDGVDNADAQDLFDEFSLDAELLASGSYRVDLPTETGVDELYAILQTLRADDRVAEAQALTDED